MKYKGHGLYYMPVVSIWPKDKRIFKVEALFIMLQKMAI